ncbi:MAG: GAF domain-containing protein [Pirellulales bacterium]
MTTAMPQERILEHLPDGVVVLDSECVIQWANQKFRQWTGCDDPIDLGFYEVLKTPELLGPDFCPFNTALVMGEPSGSRIRTKDNRFFHFHVSPVRHEFLSPQQLIVTIREVTQEVLQLQMMEAIHKAGSELAKMLPEEVGRHTEQERAALLKEDILHFTQHLLHFDVIEIRLLDHESRELTPLLSYGLDREAAERKIFAEGKGNGITGFVASTGKSYLCEETFRDPIYRTGASGAKSSMTVPLMLHDQVIGTFNVESPIARAFSESDLQFLEIFSRAVANSLNTLDLLHAQQIDTAQQSVEAIHREVAKPIDDILNSAVLVMERHIGKDCQDWDRMRTILQNARSIKDVIMRIGQTLAPSEALPASDGQDRSRLRNRRILVIDSDEQTHKDSHDMLEKFGCVVEIAHHGEEAQAMIRSCDPSAPYDLFLTHFLLDDMTGYDFLVKLKEHCPSLPIIMMKGFGYDPLHIIRDSIQAGMNPKAQIFKPLKPEQVVDTVDLILEWLEEKSSKKEAT